MAELRADGQRVLVTAGASGIGRAIAEVLAEAGARVHICDVDSAALKDFRRDRPEVWATTADVAEDAAVDQLFREVQAGLGGLDVLVNNAGLAGPTGPGGGHRCPAAQPHVNNWDARNTCGERSPNARWTLMGAQPDLCNTSSSAPRF